MTDVEKSGNLEVLSSISIELDALRLGPLNSTRVCKITLRTEFTRYLESSTNYIQTRRTKFLQNGKRKIISFMYSRKTKETTKHLRSIVLKRCTGELSRRSEIIVLIFFLVRNSTEIDERTSAKKFVLEISLFRVSSKNI